MNDKQLQRLITMANQICRNSPIRDHQAAVDFVEAHLRRFWSRSMKEKLRDYAEHNGAALDEGARLAVRRL